MSFFRDPEERLPGQLLQAWPSLVDVAEAAQTGGARVSVVQASSHSAHFTRAGIDYWFLPFGAGEEQGRTKQGLAGLLARISPDVLHVHGLGFARDVLSLSALVPGTPIVLQDHADRPPRFWRRSVWRRAIAAAAGVAFCADEQARPFVDSGLLTARTSVYEIPESTSRFAPGDRREARERTGIAGDPAVLWVGHLDDNKDPLTVLDGIAAAAEELPGLRLWCCFGSAPLLPEVNRRIAADPRLSNRVHLQGRVPHEQIEQLMRAADLFVLGSHHEGSGYSLIEALACALPPVVTDIPSFRTLTGEGTVGALWPCGDSRALARALTSARFDLETRAAVRMQFDRELSLRSLGTKLVAMYVDVHERKNRRHDRPPASARS